MLGDRGRRGDSLSFDGGFGTCRTLVVVKVESSGGLTSICIGWSTAGRLVKKRRPGGAVGSLLPAGLGNGSRDLLIAAAIGRDECAVVAQLGAFLHVHLQAARSDTRPAARGTKKHSHYVVQTHTALRL